MSTENISGNDSAKIIGYYHYAPDEFSVAIVLAEHWHKYGFLDNSGSEEPFIPDGFGHLQEGIYEGGFASHQEALDALHRSGFVYKKLFNF